MKSRNFSIMQYVQHPTTKEPLLDENKIKEAISHKSVKAWAYILHDKDVYSEADEEVDPNRKAGTVKPPHWHIVLQCGYAVEISVIAKWLGIAENYVEVPKGAGAFLDCVEYLTHETYKQQELGKHRYDDQEVKSNFNFRDKIDKRNVNKVKYGKIVDEREQLRIDVTYGGKTIRQCREGDPLLYIKEMDKIKKYRMDYLSSLKPPKTRLNFYICGEGGSGKGLLSMAIARSMYPNLENDDEIFFVTGAKGAMFEGYDGQPVIIWDDKRAIDLITELNGRGNVFNVFDTHPKNVRQNIKYGSVNLINCVNIVNGPDEYGKFLDELAGEYTDRNGMQHDVEDKKQAYRRFPIIIPIHKEDFDILINKGYMNDTDEFDEIIAHKNIIGNLQRINAICSKNEKLAREIEAQTIKELKEPVDIMMGKLEKEPEQTDAEILEMFKDYGKTKEIVEIMENGIPVLPYE